MSNDSVVVENGNFQCFWSHHESKKQGTKLLHISLPDIDRFSKFFRRYTQQKICNKASITDLTTPKRCRHTAL